MDGLTKDEQAVLVSLYKVFVSRRSYQSISEANYFQNSDTAIADCRLNYSSDDMADICWSLSEKKYLSCEPGDDLANDISLTSFAIERLEHRFSDGLTSVIDFLSKLVSFFP